MSLADYLAWILGQSPPVTLGLALAAAEITAGGYTRQEDAPWVTDGDRVRVTATFGPFLAPARFDRTLIFDPDGQLITDVAYTGDALVPAGGTWTATVLLPIRET